MPGPNPKHLKKVEQTKPMGLKHDHEKCNIQNCTEESAHSLSIQNLEGYIEKLGFKFNIDTKKNKRISLCKKHYKEYKKLKDKDDKYQNYRDFGAIKSNKRDKTHNFLE
jgi:hypothetical protein